MSQQKQVVDIKENFKIKLQNGETHWLQYPNDGQLELFEIQKKRNTEIRQDGSIKYSDRQPGVASVWFYDLLFVQALNKEGKELKKEKVPVLTKDAIATALWKNFILEPSEAREQFGYEIKEDVIPGLFYLSVIHDSKKTLTIHQLKEPGLSHFETWKLLNESDKERVKKNKVVLVSKNKVLKKIKLYDDLFVSAVGYSENKKEAIPGTHKLEVIGELFSVTDQEVLDLD